MTTVLVCGGRDYNDRRHVFEVLDDRHKAFGITLIVHGGASGADMMAGSWAHERGIPVRVFLADWKTFGKRAGPIRNAEMLKKAQPDWVIAFPGGKGTADMVRQSVRGGFAVLQYHRPRPKINKRTPVPDWQE